MEYKHSCFLTELLRNDIHHTLFSMHSPISPVKSSHNSHLYHILNKLESLPYFSNLRLVKVEFATIRDSDI